jgi:hypothetical protein
MLRFWLRRRLWFVGLNSFLTRVCFTCRHVFVEDYPGHLLEWIVRTLDRTLWPTHHLADRTYDLAREYADLLKKLEDTGTGHIGRVCVSSAPTCSLRHEE